jgi:hypothetical protein
MLRSAAPASCTPPSAPLRALVATLEGAGIACALGGSGLLMSAGLSRAARDWDLTTDAPLEQVLRALDGAPSVLSGPSGVHADHKLSLASGMIELIVGFSMHGPRGVVRLPTRVARRWKGIPVGSPEVWAVAYAMMGRAAKAEMLFLWLGRRGADRGAIEALRRESLPGELDRRLAALPPAPGS